MPSNIFVVIGVVLLVLAAVFYFIGIATNALVILLIIGILAIVAGMFGRGRV